MSRQKESLFAAFGSHDQDGRHAHIWKKPFKNLRSHRTDFYETLFIAFLLLCMQHRGPGHIIACSNDDPSLTLTYFAARSNCVTYAVL